VFVSDHSVFANHLWDAGDADLTGKQQCGSDFYQAEPAHSCWDTDPEGLQASQGNTAWQGNQLYFRALIRDMMEFDNDELSLQITRNTDEFNIVFDESRHVSSIATQPFTEAIGAVVLLTSDAYLKWLIILNLFALLAIAIMVVPEKENWRHVFDLTRFRERPTKVDSSLYQVRVREAFLSKVRQFNDLTRDEFARKTPAEIMQMVRDPRLVELVSSARSYSNEELREIIPIIRRWGN
jgi:ABC-type multidrug transport system fused ATPase/permease subunit